MLLVIEYAQACDLLYQPVKVFFRILITDAQEDEEPLSDLTFDGSLDGDAGVADSTALIVFGLFLIFGKDTTIF